MKRLTAFFCGIFLTPLILQAQCPNSHFTGPSNMCVGQPVNFTNTSSNAFSYKWDFCSSDFDSTSLITITDTSNIGLNIPFCAKPVIDGADHYVFIVSYLNQSLFRVDYGNSFSNIPSQVSNLGNPFGLLSYISGIVFYEEGGIWYALVTSTGSDQVVKLNFGFGINNSPTSGVVVVNSNLTNPRGIDIVTDSAGNIIAAVANLNSSSITLINFGNSINNTPSVGSPIAISGCSGAMDVALAHECGNWYAFVSSFNNGQIYRVDFGNSLINTPTNFPLFLSSLGNVAGVSIVNDNANWIACVMSVNRGNLYRYSMGNSLSNLTPSLIATDFISAGGPVGLELIKENSNWVGFNTVEDGSFNKISFNNSCNVNTDFSTSANPTDVIYSSPGTYHVSLEATDASGDISYYSQQVTINSLPHVNFSIHNICYGDSTLYIDSSAAASASIAGRHWNFGDGSGSNLKNPKHVYALRGSYLVTLTDTSSFGCINSDTATVIISSKPVPNFSAPFPVCPKTDLQFTDLSTIPSGSIVKWHWDFGNSDTSSLQNPDYKYPSGGNYNAVLTVTSDSACSASHTVHVSIYDAPATGFIVKNTCIGGSASFTDTSRIRSGSISTWHWNFGDGDTINIANPTHLYPGLVATYSVSLLVQSVNGCKDSITAPVKINNSPVSSFSFSPATACESNMVHFTDLSTVTGDTIYAWHWNFGDGDTSVVKNPSHVYVTPNTYTVVLTVYSQTSCSAVSTQIITVVSSPTAGFTYTATCLNDSTHFTDHSAPALGASLMKWHWDFGDGDTSNLPNPVRFFTTVGNHVVTLTVTDNIGCNNLFSTTIAVHSLPVAAFSTSIGCSSTALRFFDASTSLDGQISSYSWYFGDPASGVNDSSGDTGPTHIYYTAGTYLATLHITTVYGCVDEADSVIAVHQASAANFQYSSTCEQHQMLFTNLDTIPALDSLWSWSFGDNTGGSFLASPSHFYFLAGNYNVTLSVTSSGGCVNSITKRVEVSPNPNADFIQSPGCLNTAYSFLNTSTVTSGSIARWQWVFANGDSSNFQSPTTTYADTGDYSVSLMVTTTKGCSNTVNHIIHVYPLPVANFNYFPLFGNPPLLITFNDLSSRASQYLWQFGDGDTSSMQAPSHMYQDTGKFLITQTIYSSEGCMDSLKKIIYVIKPSLDIAVTNISYHLQNNLFSVSAQIANLGTRDISNYHMQASIQDGATLDEYVNTLLPSGAQGLVSYNFAATFQVSPEQKIDYYCVRAINPNGEIDNVPGNNEKCATVSTDFSVVQPFPNPFADQLQLEFILPHRGYLIAEVFNSVGDKIITLYDGDAVTGATNLNINTGSWGNGTYFCRFTFGEQTQVYPVVKYGQKK